MQADSLQPWPQVKEPADLHSSWAREVRAYAALRHLPSLIVQSPYVAVIGGGNHVLALSRVGARRVCEELGVLDIRWSEGLWRWANLQRNRGGNFGSEAYSVGRRGVYNREAAFSCLKVEGSMKCWYVEDKRAVVTRENHAALFLVLGPWKLCLFGPVLEPRGNHWP